MTNKYVSHVSVNFSHYFCELVMVDQFNVHILETGGHVNHF
jgi:hypothetical protein